MYAFFPGYRVWVGTPTAGDVLKIVMERKTLGEQPIEPVDEIK